MNGAADTADVVLVGGTVRPGSSSEAALRLVAGRLEARGLTARLFGGEFLANLPHYDPSSADRSEGEREYIAALRGCSAVVVASPGYHGSISGPVKNALDWTEDMAKDDPAYLSGRAFGAIVTAYGWQACGTTLVALRSIAHALRAWPTPMGVTINSLAQNIAADGSGDPQVAEQLDVLAGQIAEFVALKGARAAA